MTKHRLIYLFQVILDRPPLGPEEDWSEVQASNPDEQLAVLMLMPEFVQSNSDKIIELFGEIIASPNDGVST